MISLSGKKFDEGDFTKGRVHEISGKNCKITLSPSTALEELVIVTDCAVKFGNGTELNDVVIATTDTGAKSMNASSGLQVGREDLCTEGGGAQLLSLGGMAFPAKLELHGGQLIAQSDISFSANASGIQGASMISGGSIDGTSNMDMGICGTGMEDNFQATALRLAR